MLQLTSTISLYPGATKSVTGSRKGQAHLCMRTVAKTKIPDTIYIHVLLLLLFSAFVMNGYLPSVFMKTAIVTIIKKNKTGDTSYKKQLHAYCFSYCSIKNI